MAASAVYILDLKGKVLISRNYRGDMPLNIIEKFPKMLMEAEEEGTVSWSEIAQVQKCDKFSINDVIKVLTHSDHFYSNASNDR